MPAEIARRLAPDDSCAVQFRRPPASAGRPDGQSSLLIRRLEEYLRGHTEVLLD